MNLTWTTANPIGTSAITRNLPNPGSVVFSANSGGPSAVSVSPSYGAATFYLYNNAILIAPPITITASCASGGWDPVSSKCVDPQVVSAVVSGEFYPNPISNPAAITLTCSSASQYDVLNPLTSTSLIGGPKPYGGVVVYTPSIVAQANYILRCIQGSASDQVVRTYRPIPTPAVVRLNISPITIAKEEKVVISWDAQYPTNACTLTTKVICTNNVCSVGQNTFQSTLNTLFSTGQTDSNDPATSRLITTAVTTVAPGQIGTTWRALGRKTTKFLYTTDITYDCTASGGGKETKRIQVTKIMEQ